MKQNKSEQVLSDWQYTITRGVSTNRLGLYREHMRSSKSASRSVRRLTSQKMLGRSGDTLTHTQLLISRLWTISSRTLLVAVAVQAIQGVPGGTRERTSARRVIDGRKSLLPEKELYIDCFIRSLHSLIPRHWNIWVNLQYYTAYIWIMANVSAHH